MRLFVAINLSSNMKERMYPAIRELEAAGLRTTKMENLHITLQFLGEKSLKDLGRIESSLSKIRAPPIDIRIGGMGAFPSEKYIRTVWAGCLSPELPKLASEVALALKVKSDFIPHLTLARTDRRVDIARVMAIGKDEYFGRFIADKFALMESALMGKTGPKYTVIREFPLEG
jgi:RNA 2',3'-cyclic 3'-phosphodiesterase